MIHLISLHFWPFPSSGIWLWVSRTSEQHIDPLCVQAVQVAISNFAAFYDGFLPDGWTEANSQS